MKDTRKDHRHDKAKIAYIVVCKAENQGPKTISISIDNFFYFIAFNLFANLILRLGL